MHPGKIWVVETHYLLPSIAGRVTTMVCAKYTNTAYHISSVFIPSLSLTMSFERSEGRGIFPCFTEVEMKAAQWL